MCVTNKTKVLILFIFSLINSSISAQSGLYAIFNASQHSYIDLGEGSKLDCLDTLSDGKEMTITMWVRWTDLTASGVGNWANLFTASDSTGSGDNGVWWIQHNSNNTKFEFALHTTSRSYIQSTTKPVNGTWYHLAMTYDGSKMRLYIDGSLEASLNKTGNIRQFPSKTKLNIGRWANAGNGYRKFNGNIDEISVWNCVLSSSQIDSMIRNPMNLLGASCDTSGLLGFWNFDNNTADDLTPCGNHGLIGSGASLPIDLLDFEVFEKRGMAELKWRTASETNNDYFTIEKTSNGIDWEEVSQVKGAGNATNVNVYQLTDFYSNPGTWYYRLKQTDFDGQFTYSSVRLVRIGSSRTTTMTVYPNPTQNRVTIEGDLSFNSELKVLNMYAQDVTGHVRIDAISSNKAVVHLDFLPTGLYTFVLHGESRKIVKK